MGVTEYCCACVEMGEQLVLCVYMWVQGLHVFELRLSRLVSGATTQVAIPLATSWYKEFPHGLKWKWSY